jgi:general secretion pathway protein F
MPLYRYRAIGPGGEALRGVIEGGSDAEIVSGLQKQGALVLGVVPAGRGRGLLGMELGGGSGIRGSELTDITRELATMLGAGQDLDRALRFMVEGAANKRVATVLSRVRDRVRDGAALATALEQEPKCFPRLYVGLVRAGEAGGDLANTLERVAGLLDRQRNLTSTVQSALIYPAILVVAAIGSIVLLITQVLPQFVPLFAENGVALPASTAFLLAAGNFVSAYGLLGLGILVILGFGIRAMLRKPGPLRALDRFLLRLPVVGGLLRDVIAARFARTLGMLLLNGVPLLAALAIVEPVLGNSIAREAVSAASESAKGGTGLSRALAGSPAFPARLVQLLRLGEDTARLGPLALRAADIHEESTRLGLQRLVSLLVPAITILMGAAIAGIVSSLMLAMLSLNDIAQ